MAVPSGTFWIAIALMTNALMPTWAEAYALPIARPSGRLCTNSTPMTSSERAPASLRPLWAELRFSRRREATSATTPATAARPTGSGLPSSNAGMSSPTIAATAMTPAASPLSAP